MSLAEPEAGSLYAAVIEVRHDCPIGNLTRKLPDLRLVHWCVDRRDLFQVSGPAAQVKTFREEVVAEFGGKQVHATPEGILLVTEICRCGPEEASGGATAHGSVVAPGIGATIRRAGVWEIPPVVYREGWESWRVIAWSEKSMRQMFGEIRKFAELRLVSLRPIENLPMEQMMLMPAADVFSGLTEKQSNAVLMGLRYGYYSLPSETNIDRLSEGIGLSPSTFSEHLRKAEARILRNLRPYLEAYALRGPGEVVVAEVPSPSGERNGRGSPVSAAGT